MNLNILETKNIIKKIRDNNHVFYSLTGNNGSGKTTLLNNIKKEFENDGNTFVFNLDNEIIIKNELKENKSQEEFKAQLRKYINKHFSKFINIDIEKNEEFNEAKEKIKNFLEELNKVEFEYFKKSFSGIFQLDKNLNDNKILLEIINSNNQPKDFSSGEGMFSLLFLLKTILEKINEKNNQRILIVIDEPEKFLHDSLVKKISSIFFNLFINNDNLSIIFSTHSSFLINELVNLFKNNDKKFECLKFECLKLINKNEFINVSDCLFNKKMNTRELSIITKSIFDENIILVEGINDFEFANLLCIEKFNEYFFNIYDCQGKNIVKKICEQILLFNQNVFCFFDKDYNIKGEKEPKNKSDEFRKYFDDNKLFYYEFDDNIEKFFENKYIKKDFAAKINIEEILKHNKVNNIIEKLKSFFNSNKNMESNDD